ncbi:MAG: hypothetical protein M3256_17895 [Actinomycetota bacterium]|nr:hypothetical protein [Actinomycetota bacterium]
MHPATPETPTKVAARRDIAPAIRAPTDDHVHELALAQIEAMDRAYAGLERRLDRIVASLAAIETAPTPAVPVAPGQLRLVVNG